MATAGQIAQDAAIRIQDYSQRAFTTAQLVAFVNVIQNEWVNETEELVRENAFNVVSGEYDMAAPADIKLLDYAFWMPTRRPLEVIGPDEFESKFGYMPSQTAGTPRYITLEGSHITAANPGGFRFRLFPSPNSASQATTLAAAITTTSQSSFQVVDPADLRSPSGWVKIGSEKILYQNYNTTTGVASSCRRAMGGTVAATALLADAVTQLDLHVVYRFSAPAITADADIVSVHPDYHNALAYGVAAMALRADNRLAQAEVEYDLYLKSLREAKRNMHRRRTGAPLQMRQHYK